MRDARFLAVVWAVVWLACASVVGACGSDENASSNSSATAGAAGDTSSGGAGGSSGSGGTVMEEPTVLAESLAYPWCLAADASNVYFCASDQIGMVPIGGGTPTMLADNPNNANNLAIAVSPSTLYVLDYAGAIGKVPLPGGGWSWLLSAPVVNPGRGIVLAGSTLYWLAQLAGNGAGKVMQVDVSGGTPTAAATGQTLPWEIAGDANDLFWTNQSSQSGAIMGMALPSGTPKPLTTAVSASRVAMDATNVYYIAAGADGFLALLEVPRTGGAAKEIFGHTTGLPLTESPVAVATDGAAVYVSTAYKTSGRIYKVSPSGGGTLVVEENTGVPELLADATNLYWMAGGSDFIATLKKIPKP